METWSLWTVVVPLLLTYSLCSRAEANFAERPKIAIIGAGVGGTSAAYFLSNIKGFQPSVDIYSKDPVGGRLATLTVAGHEYETGGSILHPRNKYMKMFADQFGLMPKLGISGKFGIYDGNKFTFQQGNWGVVNIISLLWRYGFSVVKVDNMVEDMLKKFERIYKLQQEGNIFTNISELLWAMDPSFVDMLETSLEKGLKENGVSDSFIQELAMAIMRVNYGQSIEAHQFVGSVSLAGAVTDLWSVHGGNKRIPAALLNASSAQFHSNEVETIRLTDDDKFALAIKGVEDAAIYDAVIIGTPLTHDSSSLEFVNFPKRFRFPGSFHRTVCTMVHGDINYQSFGFSDEASAPDEIFTTNTSLFFNSMSRNYPVNVDDGIEGLPNVWKVFSNDLLDRDQLATLFYRIHEMHVVDWKAYPEYNGMSAADAGNFTLHPGLFHINTVEWAASAMEMSVIGARNVALLTANHFGIDIRDPSVNRNAHIEL